MSAISTTTTSSSNNKSSNIQLVNDYKEHNLPSLTPLNHDQFYEEHLGPTDSSNWLIPNRILMSAYPGDLSLEKSKIKIAQLLQSGINCFICLQLNEELTRFIPYKPLIEEYCNENNIEFEKIEFLQCPIPDNFITTDEKVVNFINILIDKVKNPEFKCLIHCWGGHGRTGTISSILLSHLYQLNSVDALQRVSKVHSCRIVRKSRAPQTSSQFKQVERLSYGYIKNSDDENDEY